eukprot:6182814-Prymnesium_polylepis.1
MLPEDLEQLRALQRRWGAAAADGASPAAWVRWPELGGDLWLVAISAACAFAAMALRPFMTPSSLHAYHLQVRELFGYSNGSIVPLAAPGEALGEAAGVWGIGVLAATITKLSASVDDAVWLLPFVCGPRTFVNAARAVQCKSSRPKARRRADGLRTMQKSLTRATCTRFATDVLTMCGVAAMAGWLGTMGASYTAGALDERSLALLSGASTAHLRPPQRPSPRRWRAPASA